MWDGIKKVFKIKAFYNFTPIWENINQISTIENKNFWRCKVIVILFMHQLFKQAGLIIINNIYNIQGI